jgi:hypothetical protein
MTTTSDRVRLLELVEQELDDRRPPPACPDWCAKPAGHEYDATDYDSERYASLGEAAEARDIIVCRYHRRYFRDEERETVAVAQLEYAEVRAGVAPVVTLDRATVGAEFGFQDEMPVADAREIAQAFLDAAALVERINSRG